MADHIPAARSRSLVDQYHELNQPVPEVATAAFETLSRLGAIAESTTAAESILTGVSAGDPLGTAQLQKLATSEAARTGAQSLRASVSGHLYAVIEQAFAKDHQRLLDNLAPAWDEAVAKLVAGVTAAGLPLEKWTDPTTISKLSPERFTAHAEANEASDVLERLSRVLRELEPIGAVSGRSGRRFTRIDAHGPDLVELDRQVEEVVAFRRPDMWAIVASLPNVSLTLRTDAEVLAHVAEVKAARRTKVTAAPTEKRRRVRDRDGRWHDTPVGA